MICGLLVFSKFQKLVLCIFFFLLGPLGELSSHLIVLFSLISCSFQPKKNCHTFVTLRHTATGVLCIKASRWSSGIWRTKYRHETGRRIGEGVECRRLGSIEKCGVCKSTSMKYTGVCSSTGRLICIFLMFLSFFLRQCESVKTSKHFKFSVRVDVGRKLYKSSVFQHSRQSKWLQPFPGSYFFPNKMYGRWDIRNPVMLMLITRKILSCLIIILTPCWQLFKVWGWVCKPFLCLCAAVKTMNQTFVSPCGMRHNSVQVHLVS